jgi:hypothetical protein
MLINSDQHPAAQAMSRQPSDKLRSVGAAAWSLVGVALLFLAVALMLTVLRPIVLRS